MRPARPTRQPLGSFKDWHAIVLLGFAVAVFFRGILSSQFFLWEDFLTQVYPFRSFAAVALSNGELPLWNPYAYGGMPFQADIQSAVFYLPNLALTFFVQDGRLSYYALEVMLVAHYWLAGVTMYYLAREFDLEPVYAFFSGLVFALSGFMIVRAIHPGFVEQVAWFPLIVLLFHRAMRRHSVRYAIGGGLVFGHAILAGAPQITLLMGLFLGLFFMFLLGTGVRDAGLAANVPKLWIVAIMGAATVGIAAIQLLPTIELIPLSQRATLSFASAQHGRLDWSQLVSAIIPKFQGAETAQESTYWGRGEYGAFWETCFFLGIPGLLAVALSVTLARANHYVAFLIGVVVLSLLLSVGDQFILHRIFFTIIPGFASFRAMGRTVMLVTFCGALLAGFGVRQLAGLAAARPRALRFAILGAAAAILVVCGLVWRDVYVPEIDPKTFGQMHAYAIGQTQWALGVALVTAVAALLSTRAFVGPGIVMAGLVLIQFVDVSHFGYNQNNGRAGADEYYYKARERIAPLVADSGPPFRVVSRQDQLLLLDRNQGMVDRLFMLEGYTPLALQRRMPPAPTLERAYDLLNAKYRIVVDSQAKQMGFMTFPSYVARAFVVHDVRAMVDSAAVDVLMRVPSFDPRRTVVIDEATPSGTPDITAPDGAAHVVRYRLNSIDVMTNAARPGMLVLSEVYYPGWTATVDDAPAALYRADWVLRAVPIPTGSHRVRVRFEAPPFRRGALITSITLALGLGILLWPAVRRRSDRATAPS